MKFTAVLLSLATFAFALPTQKRGQCANPSVRVEWRSLTQVQRNQFHQAVKCLQTKPSNVQGQSLYDRYASLHVDMFDSIHYVSLFLPWHRLFTKARETSLRECGYTAPLPYWDWTRDSNDFAKSEIFDATKGFGGNGQSSRQPCVADGTYSSKANFSITYPNSRCLQRQFNLQSRWGGKRSTQHSPQVVQQLMQYTKFSDFSDNLEEGPHDTVHNEISGDMAWDFSPAESLFFLHHNNVDRLWALWQAQNPARLQDYSGNTVQGQSNTNGSRYPLATLDDQVSIRGLENTPDMKVRDVMDTRSEALCYVYDA